MANVVTWRNSWSIVKIPHPPFFLGNATTLFSYSYRQDYIRLAALDPESDTYYATFKNYSDSAFGYLLALSGGSTRSHMLPEPISALHWSTYMKKLYAVIESPTKNSVSVVMFANPFTFRYETIFKFEGYSAGPISADQTGKLFGMFPKFQPGEPRAYTLFGMDLVRMSSEAIMSYERLNVKELHWYPQ